MSLALGVVLILAALVAGALLSYAWCRRAKTADARPAAAAEPRVAAAPGAVIGSIDIVRPQTHSVEGLEIKYGSRGLVRSVCVGAMNTEHKELLLTMDGLVWRTLPNAHKQEVLAAARSTWAAKMCPDGADIAYVVVKTDSGEVVGRADPHSLTIL